MGNNHHYNPEEIIKDYEGGMSLAEVAKKHRMCSKTASKVLQRAKVTMRQHSREGSAHSAGLEAKVSLPKSDEHMIGLSHSVGRACVAWLRARGLWEDFRTKSTFGNIK